MISEVESNRRMNVVVAEPNFGLISPERKESNERMRIIHYIHLIQIQSALNLICCLLLFD